VLLPGWATRPGTTNFWAHPTMVRRGHLCARGARRAPHGPRARAPRSARRPLLVQRRAPGAPPAEDARPPPRTIVAGMVGVSRNTRGAPAPVVLAVTARPSPPTPAGEGGRPSRHGFLPSPLGGVRGKSTWPCAPPTPRVRAGTGCGDTDRTFGRASLAERVLLPQHPDRPTTPFLQRPREKCAHFGIGLFVQAVIGRDTPAVSTVFFVSLLNARRVQRQNKPCVLRKHG